MTNEEIVTRLKRIADHAVHIPGEKPFVMSLDDGIAIHEAIEIIKALSQQTDTLDVLQKIRQEISHITDMEVVRGGLYVREFEVAEIIDKHISEYTGEQA